MFMVNHFSKTVFYDEVEHLNPKLNYEEREKQNIEL
jgi:hypothetical protein